MQILEWLNKRNFNSDPWSDVGDQLSVDPVDSADVCVREREEGVDLVISGATVE